MALAPRLDLRQTQTLKMTPQLQQAIKLLALSNLEIEGFIAEELERNPLLEIGGEDTDSEPPGEDRTTSEEPESSEPGEPETADRLLEHGAAETDAPLDVDFEAETFQHSGAGESGLGGGDAPEMDMFAGAVPSLHEHLLTQAGEIFSGVEFVIAAHLIDLIDEAGYLVADLTDVAIRLGVPSARVEAVMTAIHAFDPTGVGARNLSECLALQAREADRYDPAMACFIENLELLAAGKLAQLQRLCGVDDEDLADMIRELRGYDPKPGLRFGGTRTETVVPDVFVARKPGGWAIELNGASLPRLLVNRAYHLELATGARDKSAKAWLGEQLQSANWLLKALDQRQRTIIKVAAEIVKQQEGFFRQGVAHLRPLTLRQVAEQVGLHESTVSRVTSNKYLSCARGMFELKYFFTSAIQAADGGEAVSAQAVKSAIRSLIAAEQVKNVLSDDTLVDLLRAQGFDIARRTVAKYREALGIGSSVQRRRQKALERRAA